MTTAAKGGPDWRRLAPAVAVGVILAGASAQSLIFLTGRWQAQAPVRAERAARIAADRAAREQAEAAAAPTPVPGAPAIDDAPASVRVETSSPVVWVTPPRYRVSPEDIAPGFESISVDFSCLTDVEGRLHDCTARETPAGSGLARATLPALAQARIEPMRVGGRAVEGMISFGVSYRMTTRPVAPSRRAAPEAAPDAAAAPEAAAPAPEPTAPPPEALEALSSVSSSGALPASIPAA